MTLDELKKSLARRLAADLERYDDISERRLSLNALISVLQIEEEKLTRRWRSIKDSATWVETQECEAAREAYLRAIEAEREVTREAIDNITEKLSDLQTENQ